VDIKQKFIYWATRGRLNDHCNNKDLLGMKQWRMATGFLYNSAIQTWSAMLCTSNKKCLKLLLMHFFSLGFILGWITKLHVLSILWTVLWSVPLPCRPTWKVSLLCQHLCIFNKMFVYWPNSVQLTTTQTHRWHWFGAITVNTCPPLLLTTSFLSIMINFPSYHGKNFYLTSPVLNTWSKCVDHHWQCVYVFIVC